MTSQKALRTHRCISQLGDGNPPSEMFDINPEGPVFSSSIFCRAGGHGSGQEATRLIKDKQEAKSRF